MRMTLRAAAALLSYPSAELKANIGEVRSALRADGVLTAEALRRLEPLLASFETEELLDLQAEYTELFDRSRKLSLHLFEHIHGDGRERGQAMIDLGQQYIEHGFVMRASELPDFLPLFLEFASCLPAPQARDWLGQPAHVLAALEERLAQRGSRYAAVLHALVALPEARPDPAAIAELNERVQGEDEKSIDEQWEEVPVKFGTAAFDAGGPTGVIAKIRAARRAAGAALKK